MNVRRFAALAAATSAATLSLALAAPAAQAQSIHRTDPADATASLTDIRGVSVDHGTRNVKLTVDYTDLRRRSAAEQSIYFDVDRSKPGPEFVLGTGLNDGTDYALLRTKGWKGTTGNPVECQYRLSLDFQDDKLRAVVGRGCLGNPDGLRVGFKMTDWYDGSHPVTDWYGGTRSWARWVTSG